MDKLKNIILQNNLDKEITSKLLVNLRYLVKHVAFKEEQECRIIRIESSGNNKVKTNPPGSDSEQMFMEYLNIRDHVSKIWFAPKMPKVESYIDRMRHEGLDIDYCTCNHPFA